MPKNDQLSDIDPQETQEWLEAIDFVLEQDGATRVQFLLDRMSHYAKANGVQTVSSIHTPYLNTLSSDSDEAESKSDSVIHNISALRNATASDTKESSLPDAYQNGADHTLSR